MKRQENFTKTLPFLYQKFVFGHLPIFVAPGNGAEIQARARSPMARSIFSV
jgi:hypothetical protein